MSFKILALLYIIDLEHYFSLYNKYNDIESKNCIIYII